MKTSGARTVLTKYYYLRGKTTFQPLQEEAVLTCQEVVDGERTMTTSNIPMMENNMKINQTWNGNCSFGGWRSTRTFW